MITCKSQINSDFLKCVLNLKSNDSQYTITPYAICGVAGFRQNDIVMW